MENRTKKDAPQDASKYHFIEADAKGVFIRVRVQPRASKSALDGVTEDGSALKVRLTAPPVEGEANSALVDFLSDLLGVRKRDLEIAGGQRSRNKRVRVEGIAVQGLTEIFSRKLKDCKKG